jgi:antitoxin YokJ
LSIAQWYICQPAAMTKIDDLIRRMQQSPRCRVLPPAGQPKLPEPFALPPELARFYELCGGVEFLEEDHGPYSRYRIVAPAEVVDICMATVGDAELREPPLDGWFAVGEDDNSEHVAIELNEDGYGRCYDVFHETFSDPYSARIVALSFIELVERLFARGRSYWFDDGFETYGYYGDG